MVIQDDSYFYTLCYPEHCSNTYLKLYRFAFKDGAFQILGDSIPIRSEKISNGNKVYNDWKKGADGQRRYLDGNGTMAVNSWVDGEYYVDSNGIMVTEKWLHVPEDDGEDEWYYFSASGKKVEDTWKKISDKWYHFDSNGAMERGCSVIPSGVTRLRNRCCCNTVTSSVALVFPNSA